MRCRPRQIRLVTQNAKTGPTKNRIRKTQVIVLIERAKCVAMRSFDPRQGQDDEGREERDPPEARAGRDVARAVEHVVLAVVAGHLGLDERVHEQEREQQARDDDRRHEDVQRQRVVAPPRDDLGLARHEAQRTLEEQHVPVGLGACGHR